MRRARIGAAGAAAAAALALAAGVALSQEEGEAPPGAQLFLDVSAGLRSTDNPDRSADAEGSDTAATANIALSFASETRTQQLNAVFTTRLASEQARRDAGITDSALRLAYARQSGASALRFTLRYSEQDNGFELAEDGETGADLKIDQGRRQNTALGFELETGRDAPVGFTLRADASARRFFDTTDPDLTDEDRRALSAALRLSLTPTADLSFTARYADRETDNARDTAVENVSYGLGLSVLADPTLRLSARISHARTDVTETIGGQRETRTEESPVFALSAAKERRNGVLNASLVRDLSGAGARTTLRFGRTLALRNGSLEASAGLTRTDDADIVAVGALDYAHQLRNGRLALGFSRSVRTDDDATDVARTALRLGYSTDLNRLSGLRLSADFSSVEEIGTSGDDEILRGSIGITYVRALSEDWNLNAGYRHTRVDESDARAIAENRIFATVGRRFNLRP